VLGFLLILDDITGIQFDKSLVLSISLWLDGLLQYSKLLLLGLDYII